MSIIAWIVLGAIAGYLAGFLVRVTRDSASSATSCSASSVPSSAASSPARCSAPTRSTGRSTSRRSSPPSSAPSSSSSWRMRHGQLAARRGLTGTGPGRPRPVRRGAHRSPRWASDVRPKNPSTTGRSSHVQDRANRSTCDVPVREAYDQWTQFEEFPRFMDGVESRPAGRRHAPPLGRRDRRPAQGVGRRDHRAGAGPARSRGRRPTGTGTPASVDFHRLDDTRRRG